MKIMRGYSPPVNVDSAAGHSRNTISGRSGNIGASNIAGIGNLSAKRTQLDALIIAQVSKNVLDKALVISSRLKSIASAAFLTGRIDNEEVMTQLSHIQGTMSQYGERVLTPISDKSNSRGEFLENAERVRVFGEKLAKGDLEKEDLKQIDESIGNFKKSSRNANLSVQSDLAYVSLDRKSSQDNVKEVSSGISREPESYMMVQGNITLANAKFITN